MHNWFEKKPKYIRPAVSDRGSWGGTGGEMSGGSETKIGWWGPDLLVGPTPSSCFETRKNKHRGRSESLAETNKFAQERISLGGDSMFIRYGKRAQDGFLRGAKRTTLHPTTEKLIRGWTGGERIGHRKLHRGRS